MGSINKNPPKGMQYEDYNSFSSSSEDTKSDSQTTKLPKVTENFYTDRLFGDPISNYYSMEPTEKQPTKDDLKELKRNAKNDLVLIKQVFGNI